MRCCVTLQQASGSGACMDGMRILLCTNMRLVEALHAAYMHVAHAEGRLELWQKRNVLSAPVFLNLVASPFSCFSRSTAPSSNFKVTSVTSISVHRVLGRLAISKGAHIWIITEHVDAYARSARLFTFTFPLHRIDVWEVNTAFVSHHG